MEIVLIAQLFDPQTLCLVPKYNQFNDPGDNLRSSVQELVKIEKKMGHISNVILSKEFILGTTVQSNNVHSMA